ncbi:MAG: SMI1/KNR4 family protein [Psychrobacillus sp.]|uniref:SMI1/KNR4 family protein n=1 Tax=unclassified Psychrobacillus TaxID=2636677 RepID=UPI00203EC418|nr:SMI1/KNR4 family protein [Psychrobacillus sp. MER TA 171]MCM3359023.1 SMI1/KNR4 family protein [Psychrobacillus sp. MER TA 171]
MKVDTNTIVSPLPTDGLLDVVEHSLRVTFPEPYREFIKKNNGAVPITNIFSSNENNYIIERFLCILEESESDEINGWYDIEVTITQIGERLTDDEDLIGMNVVPIAALFTGDFVCLDYSNRENPTVVVWYHEESEEFSPVTKTVAQDISEFFTMFKE